MRAFGELWDEITAERYGVDGPEAPPLPLRRAGELARPHRAAAREQRLPHPDRDAGRDAVEERARARRAAAGLERGARPAAAVGPAVVAPHAADPGLRDRPARVRRHLRRLDGDRGQGRGAEGSGHGRARAHRGHGRRGRGHRLHEAARWSRATPSALRASRRGEQIVVGVNRWTETEPSPLSPGDGAHPGRRSGVEAEQIERLQGLARGARRQGGRRRARRARSAPPREGRNIMEPSIACAKAGVTTGEWGDDAARGVRRVPRADRRRAAPRPRATAASLDDGARRGRARLATGSAGASRSWSASPASTATPTAPSRSPCAPATAAWRSSTRASA